MLATSYVVVDTTRHLSRTTFWFVDTDRQTYTQRQTYTVKTIPISAIAAGKHFCEEKAC